MMNTLEEKYIHNELTAEELKQLRQEVLQLSDESIAATMQDHWMNDEIDTTTVPVSRLDQIKTLILGFAEQYKLQLLSLYLC